MEEEEPKVFFGINRTRTSLLARTTDTDDDTEQALTPPITATPKDYIMRMATVRQVDDSTVPDKPCTAMGERCMLLSMFERSIEDLSLDDRKNRKDAIAWLFSDSISPWSAVWCAEQIDERIEKFRQRAKEAIAKYEARFSAKIKPTVLHG